MQDFATGENRTPISLATHYRGLRTLVTGGLGFIGSNVARRLAELGAEVLVVDSLQTNTGGNAANLRGLEDRVQVRVLDLRSTSEFPEIVREKDVIFNLAGHVSHLDSMTNPVADLGANVHAQIVLLDCCRTYSPQARIVFASTRQIYGKPSTFPVDEGHPLHPVDVNGINKMAAEAYHSLYYEVYGLQSVSLRLTNTFGPGMRIKDARQTFLGIWLRHVVEDGVFEVWGGQQKRDLTYVDDAVDAFLLAAACQEAQGKVFNIGGSAPIALLDLAGMLVKAAGSGRYETREFPPERLRIDIGDYYADDRRFRQLTGWEPKISLPEGLGRTVDFYRRHLSDYV
jgi:UDP-glucose 4-epimerase